MSDVTAQLSTALSDRYRVERELGSGGMATVYLARDLKHDRDVAIKVLHPDLGAALGGDRFLAEIRTTARLQHPHILPLLDSGSADGLLYYVMPLITGETLRARLERERQLPIDEAVKIAREVADALGHAHALGIVHRDIKPENILLQGGHALVADFGIALAVQQAGGQRMTKTGLSLGTPQYMSPEQAMGERTIDLRSDIYALGAVTYEMLAGEPPFMATSVQAIIARILTEEPRSLLGQRKAVPNSVDAAVLRALEKLPADRFADAAAFVSALDAGVPVTRRATTGARRASRVSSRGFVAAALGFAAIALVAGWMLGRRDRSPAHASAWSASVVLPDSVVLDPLRTTSEGMVTMALSPDGTQLAFVARRGEHTQLFIRRLSDFSARAIDGTEGAAAPFFSPAGDAIAFFSGPVLKRLSLGDGRVTDIASNIRDQWGGAWAQNGRIIIARDRASQLLVLGPSGDSLRGINCNGGCSFPEVLPDGHHIMVSDRAGGLRTIDIETDSMTPLLRAGDAAKAQARVRGVLGKYDGDGHLVYVGPGGQILAASFDVKRGVLTGTAVPVAEGVRVETGRGAAQFALSRVGVLAYAPGPVMSVGILVRADRAGKLDTIPVSPANYNSLELSPDGRRLAVRVETLTGELALQVIDVVSGKVTPWLTGPALGRPSWASDGRRLVVTRGREMLIGDPDLSTPPRPLALSPNLSEPYPMNDSASFRGFIGDTLAIQQLNGRSPQRNAVRGGVGATSSDDRWYVSEEAQGSTSSLVARALDGSGRRIVIAGDARFAMVGWAGGGHEFIVADAQRLRDRGKEGTSVQGFWAIAYDASKPNEPFGEPRELFRAVAADFPGRNYTAAMGGNRFVFKQHLLTPPPREIRVMSDWHQRLQAETRP